MIVLGPEQEFLASLVMLLFLFLGCRDAIAPWLRARALARPPRPDPD